MGVYYEPKIIEIRKKMDLKYSEYHKEIQRDIRVLMEKVIELTEENEALKTENSELNYAVAELDRVNKKINRIK